MTKEYEIACKAHSDAAAIFLTAQKAYRARRIGDAEFLQALAIFKIANTAFDAAFASEIAP
jgi:hypothetical protein